MNSPLSSKDVAEPTVSEQRAVLNNPAGAVPEPADSSAGTTPASNWQPVATAPADTLLLCYWTPVAEGGPDAIGTAKRSFGTWHRAHSMHSELRTPSHWMPIPPPPVKTPCFDPRTGIAKEPQ